ncbi:oxygenase MpaB family protein [Nocardia sp. NPDC127579]|uniref:oxygenase MpaB family protein n=1 Tax=Nocardia sp. NPDC127579 TaxID=3345402 RepID=UPI00363A8E89
MKSKVPLRHPDVPRPIPGIDTLASLLRLREPSREQWAELGEALVIGDEPMDRLVAWMIETGLDRTRSLFEEALSRGVETVPEAPEPLREFFAQVQTPPDWLDRDKIRHGAQVYRIGGVDGLYLARDVAFLGGYLASGFNKTLIRTGALEKGPAQRFAETLQWALDVTSDAGLEPWGRGYRSTLRVRLIHALVRTHVAALPDWDSDRWGLPINQTDMAATLIGALMVPFLGAFPMGIVPAARDLESAAHLTRYVGWLIGVEERFLPNGFRDSVRLLNHTLAAITNPDETTRQLALPMGDDPLNWHYQRLSGVRGRVARSRHLSIATTFLGPKAMRRLGLPAHLPWYPMVRAPVNAGRSTLVRALPGAAEFFAARGRRAQEGFLRTLIGADSAVIGESVSAIRPN